tara:strand:- start:96 stop:704 length:609 start_codon:yes stop_codon:yes gene_type:complete
MLKIFRSSILFLLLLLLSSGCTGTKRLPVNFSAPNIGVSSTKLDAELKSLTVTVARPDEATGQIRVAAAVGSHGKAYPISLYLGLWRTALEEAFNRMAIFKDDSPKKVSLAVKILKFDPRAIAIVHTSARYEIIDRSDGSIIFTTDISTSGEGPFRIDPFCAMCAIGSRQVDGINRSVQKNIIQFLQALETVDIDKPIFPSN